MRKLLIIAFLLGSVALKAQSLQPIGLFTDSSRLAKKWSVMPYGGIGAGFGFSPAGQTNGFLAPMGVQVNRRISNNWYAFANATVAPGYSYFNQSFLSADVSKNLPLMSRYSANGLGIYNSVGGGLMYVNDARTFSISGSIHYSRSSYPAYPFYQGSNTAQQALYR